MDIQITDEHLTKLEITENSLLMLKVPRDLCHEEMAMIRQNVQKSIQERTGIDPCVIVISGDIEITLLDAEALHNLKAEIDLIILKQLGPHKEPEG